MSFANSPSCACCADCTLFADTFDRADSTSLGSDWTEVSGDSEIASNVLLMNSSAIVSHSFATDDRVDRVVKVLVQAESNGDIARIHLGNPASTSLNRMYAEIEFASGADNGRLRIYGVTATTHTLRRECPITAEAGNWYTFWFGNHLHLGEVGQTVNQSCYVWFDDEYRIAWVHTENGYSGAGQLRYIGLESIATNYVEFDTLSVEKTDDGSNNCDRIGECCWPNLETYVGVQLEVEITGGTDNTCSDCETIAGTYTLTLDEDSRDYPPTSGSDNNVNCGGFFTYTGAVGDCSDWEDITLGVLQDANTNVNLQRCRIFVRVGNVALEATVTLPNDPLEVCDTYGWVDVDGSVTPGSFQCSGPFTVRVRVKP